MQSGNPYLAQDNSGTVSAQNENQNKVRIITFKVDINAFNKYILAFIFRLNNILFKNLKHDNYI